MDALAGTGSLVRLVVRRDRVILPAWILITALLPMTVAVSTNGLYKNAAERAAFAAGVAGSPAELFTRGTVFSSSVGGLTSWTLSSSSLIIGGLISILLVIRHTRVEEEAGRRELVGATVVGRHAPLTAALLVVMAANLALGLLAAIGLIAVGQPAGGSFLFGLAIGIGGWVFAALAGMTGQISQSAAAGRSIAVAVAAAFFVLRGLGDVTGTWLVWLSPFGWSRLAKPYATDDWWVLSLPVLATAALAAGAYALSVRRDVAGGLLPARLGRERATHWLTGSTALAWRLQRGQLVGWCVSFALLGLLLGFASSGLDQQLNTPAMRAYAAALGGPGARISAVFFAVVLYVISQIVTGVAIIGVLRTRSEEAAGRAEPLLAAPVGRLRWIAGHLVVALASAVIALLALGIGAGISSGRLAASVLATLAYVPATWILVGLGVAFFGLLPRLAAALTWTVLGVFLLLDLLAEFRIVDDVSFLSPYAATPSVLVAGGASPVNLLWLTLIAAALVAIGLYSWRRRDLTP
ncbi:ABC transporter permease [Fodinicola acaciae]|uniref:ABC transporter permease n=1 Tax=Fodinicola acaciae TaxID=2681555 RepID=UPI0013D1E9C1|nr:ABC transporter permease [Fodinicola acaciae]